MASFEISRKQIRVAGLVTLALLISMMGIRLEKMTRKNLSTDRYLVLQKPTVVAASVNFNYTKVNGGLVNTSAALVIRQLPKHHIAFLKVHKAASSTVQNILYRFGLEHNLSFVLPYKGHYISTDANFYKRLIPSLNNTGKYDILCNHVVFNHQKFKDLMHNDAFYVAIVREPLKRFVSAAYYYRYVFPHSYLKKLNSESFLHNLITNPLKYEPSFRLSRTFNKMAFDFGLPVTTIKEILHLDDDTLNMFVEQLMQVFDLIMIVEKFDECLVLLKRYLNWSIKDILYIKRNEFRNKYKHEVVFQNVSAADEAIFKRINYLDYLIYNNSLERFYEKAAMEKDLTEEVKEFKHNLDLLEVFCTIDNSRSEAIFVETEFYSAFRVNRHDCKAMMMSGRPFCETMKNKQLSLIQKL